jgi:hypothetical protein
VIVHSADGNFAIRKGSYKWIEGIPADDVKPAAKKAHAIQFKPQLYDLKADIAEAREVSAQHADVVKDLAALLNRYRDGGYSRELPPAGVKPKPAFAELPPLVNAEPLDLSKFKGWAQRDGVMFGKAGDKGATLTGPVSLKDGVLEFQLLLGEADRHSLRIHTAGNKQSYRVVLSHANLDIAINPPTKDQETIQLGKQRVKFKSSEWQTLRLTFKGDELTAEFAGVTLKAQHAVLAEEKAQLNFIAFEGEVGVREVKLAK